LSNQSQQIKEKMNNEFGLINLWTEGDGVTRFVALLLLVMSLASWVVIILKTLNLFTAQKQAARIEAFWHSANVAGGVQALGNEEGNPFRALALRGQEALAHLKTGSGQPELLKELDTSDWVTRGLQNAIDDATAELQSGLAILASVGSTSPFVGLFGTVWGIYHALMQIGMAGQATIDKVAGPIGEALIMTALGLAVAIPAVLGYNALVRGNKAIITRMNRFAHDLHALLMTGSRVKAKG
jgi:biopolymer transport protein ExbB